MSDYSEEYKGAKIAYNVENNEWEIQINRDSLRPRKSLKLARSAVDETFKRETNFLRHRALLMSSWELIPCEVTSYIAPEDNSRYDGTTLHAWIRKDNGDREKVSIERLREDSAENRELHRRMLEAQKQESALTTLRYGLQKKLTFYTPRQTPK